MSNIIDSIQLSGTTYQIQGSGGKAVAAGTNISVTTGETADTINCTLPISADSNGIYTTSTYPFLSTSYKSGNVVFGYNNKIDTFGSTKSSVNNLFFGSNNYTSINVSNALFGGYGNKSAYPSNSNLSNSVVLGSNNTIANPYQASFGRFNASNYSNESFGNSGNTLFSVGNGTAENARHNAFEIRQNGDIYLTLDGQDVKLQDQLGGGGSSYTAGDGIDITNDVISVTGKVDTSAITSSVTSASTDAQIPTAKAVYDAIPQGGGVNVVQTTGTSTTDVMSQNAVTTQLSGYVTTNTRQEITGNKTFIGSINTSEKPIIFKQANDNHKIGFVCKNTASTNNELATFEFRPNTFTIDNVQHPLLYFGHYRNTNTANAGVPQTVIGFRQYDQKNAAAYHYLIPLPEKAKTPFSLTTSFKDYYAPIGFKNGSTMITTDNTGVADFSDVLGGLKLVKLTQSEYDSLATKDNSTLYVIVN